MKSARLSTNKKSVVLLITSLSLVAGLLAIRLTTPIAQNSSASSLASATKVTAENARDAYGKIELSFEANQGQTDSSVNFLARGAGYTLFLKPTEAVFRLRSSDVEMRNGEETKGSKSPSVESDWRISTSTLPANPRSEVTNLQSKVLRMKLAGANANAKASGDKAGSLPVK